ncbi:NADPH-dependent FMN reductase [Boudabousia tangfeifanii]|uniref:NADPH-dependent FMN reductase n=1 Tax=Boudabousia tangfeifanii TaxID=1912795 RepID=A0A1D9MKK7_9ACTO|nr:NAD(P)H-dependent oxidoreductase [Boudabousia tangfeifanii]AOZ72713.1 NADPH-dependent FMN reductase [Boudabousia tangfeifanii]
MAKIAIVLGSVREGRFGEQVANWVLEKAVAAMPETTFTLVDVQEFDLPIFNGTISPAMLHRQYPDPRISRWSKVMDEADGYIFVTTEYNHSIPGAFKNAIDHLSPELNQKAIAFVGYSWDGAIRAIEHWRSISAQFNLYDIRAQLALTFPVDSTEGDFTPHPRREKELATLLNQLVPAAKALKTLRA